MAAIAACSQALQNHAPPNGSSDIRQLQALLQQTSTQLDSPLNSLPQQSIPPMEHPPPRVEHSLPRVGDPNMHVTHSMSPPSRAYLPNLPRAPLVPSPIAANTCLANLSQSPLTHLPGILAHKRLPPPNMPCHLPTTHDHECHTFLHPCQSPALNPCTLHNLKTSPQSTGSP